MFRVLALSGGGARGIFQACYLARLEEATGTPVREQFDLVAATSTGALVGLAVACGVPAADVVGFYRQHAREVFRPRHLTWVRRGPHYDSSVLEALLVDLLGDPALGRPPTLAELDVDVAVCACVLDTLRGKVFTAQDDPGVGVVDAALFSTAAPTYFAPAVGRVDEAGVAADYRGYVDGGLWANDPSWVAIDHAVHGLNRPAASLRVLALGTGRIQHGYVPQDVGRLRILSVGTARLMIDTSASLQSWFTSMLCERSVHRSQLVRVDPTLRKWIELDDVARANRVLPGLADDAFAATKGKVLGWLTQPRMAWTSGPTCMEALARHRNALRQLSDEGNVPHSEERTITYTVGARREDDRAVMTVRTTVPVGSRMQWRTENFGVTDGDGGPLTLDAIGLLHETDEGCGLTVLPVDEHPRRVTVISIFQPPLDGGGTRTSTYEYNCPGTWDNLRARGEDYAAFNMPHAERLEVRIVFPPGTRAGVIAPNGEVEEGTDAGRPMWTWVTTQTRDGKLRLGVTMRG